MRSSIEINEILSTIKNIRTRFRWCENDACACMGCVNRSEKERVGNITKEEYENWLKFNKTKKI